MDGCPLGLELVVEDKPTEFSCDIVQYVNSPDMLCIIHFFSNVSLDVSLHCAIVQYTNRYVRHACYKIVLIDTHLFCG